MDHSATTPSTLQLIEGCDMFFVNLIKIQSHHFRTYVPVCCNQNHSVKFQFLKVHKDHTAIHFNFSPEESLERREVPGLMFCSPLL